MGYDNRELIPQEDGSVLIGGDVVAKLTPQGRLSPDFTPAYFEPGSGVFAMSLDGTNMIVGGEFNSFDVARTNLARLMPNGIVDPDYDPGSAADDKIYATCLQPDGRLIVGGRFTVFAGEPRSYLVRLFGDQPTLEAYLPNSNNLILNWPCRFSNWVLQTSQDVSSTNWATVTNPVTLTGNQCFVTNSVGTSNRFFRLIGP